MLTFPVFCRMLPSAAFLLAASLTLVAFESAVAQQQQERGSGQGLLRQPHRGPAIGGTSWTLSDVWGEPKMPQAPKDFGPGFDYSPGGYTLNGAPNTSPYPN